MSERGSLVEIEKMERFYQELSNIASDQIFEIFTRGVISYSIFTLRTEELKHEWTPTSRDE